MAANDLEKSDYEVPPVEGPGGTVELTVGDHSIPTKTPGMAVGASARGGGLGRPEAYARVPPGNPREDGKNDEETEEAEETIATGIKDSREGETREDESDAVTSKIKQMAQQQTGGAVLAQSDISSSQLDFFKMLDEKIENGPDYEESDEEEQKARMANLLQEWRAACLARQQKKSDLQENWSSPSHAGKPYQEDFENYPARRVNPVDTQRFPTGYSACPPNNTISIHLQNSLRVAAPLFTEQHRIQPKIPIMSNYHTYQSPGDPYNHDDSMGHPLSTNEPLNPLRTTYSQIVLRQSSINSQIQHYPENQRLYSDSIRPFSDFPRTYQDQRPYQMPRAMPTVNVLHEYRMYKQEGSGRPYQMYQDDSRQPGEVQRIMPEIPKPYHEPPKQDIRPPFGSIDNQRLYHERLKEKQRQYVDTGQMEGPRPQTSFQRPPVLTQRSIQESGKIYRDFENEDHCFPRQDRFPETSQDCSTSRMHNPYKMGRSLSVDVQYVAEPPPPREMIPLQGAPGPPQGSPRPLVARGLQTNVHRLPANSDVHYRKPQRAFT